MKNAYVCSLTVLLFIAAMVSSCKKQNEDSTDNSSNTNTPNPTSSTYLCGTVVDRQGNRMIGAEVKYGSLTETTDEFGYFSFGNVGTGERCYVNVKRNGYFETGLGVLADAGGTTNMKIVMTDNSPDYFINGSSGGEVDLGSGVTVDFPAGGIAYEDGTLYTGNVNVAVEYLNPEDPNFSQIIPGGDLIGIETGGSETQLISYGMLMVNLTDNGGVALNLAPSATATFTIPVPPSLAPGAPISMPAWHFNEATGYWEEEGTITMLGGLYTGTVTHFSTWNADVPGDRAEVTGLVTDCNGDPLPGVVVRVGQGYATTNMEGVYRRFVPTGVSFEVFVDMPQIGLTSSVASVPAASNGQVYSIQGLQTQCPATVTGTIICNTGTLTGFIALSWPGGYSNVSVTSDGTFSIPVPANGAAAELNAIGANTGIIETVNVTLPSVAGATVNAGSFDLCGSGPTGDFGISMTLNGGGFSNYNFDISTTPQFAFGNYSVPDGFMMVYASNVNADYITLSYPGTSPGTWDLENDPDAVVGFSINGDLWFAESGTLTVTQSGNVGQPISGTFSGTVSHFEGIDIVSAQMTNGTFHVIRNPDQQ
jgi:hypothetical protein